MARVYAKYKIYSTRSPWSGKVIWMAAAPGETTGRPFDHWNQAARHLSLHREAVELRRIDAERQRQEQALNLDAMWIKMARESI